MNIKSLFCYRLNSKHSQINSSCKHQVNNEQNSSTLLLFFCYFFQHGKGKGITIHIKTPVKGMNVIWTALSELWSDFWRVLCGARS